MNRPVFAIRISKLLANALRSSPIFLAAALCLGTWGHHARGAVEPDAGVLARIGDTEVKTEEIRATLQRLDAREQAALARDPALLSQTVRSLLVKKLVYKEALEKHWNQEPTVVEQLERVRQSAIVETYLESVSKPPAGFPSEAELQKAYAANKAALLVPRQYRLAQIFVAAPKGADKAAQEKAENKLEGVRKKLRQHDADFAAVARVESDEPGSAAQGGEIGWLPETRIQPEIRPQVVALGKNALSEPVRLGDGWHLLKVLDIKEPYTPALEEVREELVKKLRAERAKSDGQAYLAKLLRENPVALNELALAKVLK